MSGDTDRDMVIAGLRKLAYDENPKSQQQQRQALESLAKIEGMVKASRESNQIKWKELSTQQLADFVNNTSPR